MNLTTAQIFQIGNLVLSAFAGGAATFSAFGFSQNTITAMVAAAAFIGLLWNGIGTILTGTSQQIKDVASMPGVTKIVTNQSANETLRTIAADPANPKVEGPK